MKLFLSIIILAASIGEPLAAQVITGAGATFPYPVYSRWAHKYNQVTGVKMNYQSIGSGGGIQQIKSKTVDFGASDAPLTSAELEKFGLTQFPMVIGGVVPVVNIKGVEAGALKLDGGILADIFLGKVIRWNEPAIARLNPDVRLPDQSITVVHRADGSGTTWIFTHYLEAVSAGWQSKVGAGKAVSWPTGVGGKGNEGVAAYVQRIDGSIGYVEYAYALQNKMSHVRLRNRAGNFVEPTTETFSAVAAGADWAHSKGFHVILVDQPGDNSWPITGASYIIIHKVQQNAETAKTMLKFFDWCFWHGGELALELDYVPIPKPVVEIIQASWKKHITAAGMPVW